MSDKLYHVPKSSATKMRDVIYRSSFLYTLISLAGSLVLYFYAKSANVQAIRGEVALYMLDTKTYLIKYVLIPFIPCVIGLISGYLSIYGKRLINEKKNEVCIHLLFMVTAIPYIFYFEYSALIIGPCICSFLCILFGNKVLVRRVYIASLFSILLNILISIPIRKNSVTLIPGTFIAIIAVTIVFVISRSLVKLQIAYYRELQLRRDENIQLDHSTKLDPFTGLYNRNELFRLLGKEIESRRNLFTPLYFCIFDIDDFKQINDTYGHPTGDTVILTLCSIMKRFIPDGCYAARYGGEEFSLIFPSMTGQEVYRVAEQIRVSFENTKFPFLENSDRTNITVSCGLATHREKFKKTEELFSFADSLLYEAKKTGKNKVIFR